MPDTLVFDPYPCAWCGTRLQWVVTQGDKSSLAIVEFESSSPHACARKPCKRLPPLKASPYERTIPDRVSLLDRQEALLKTTLTALTEMAISQRQSLEAMKAMVDARVSDRNNQNIRPTNPKGAIHV